jgi:hypothetical protein
MVVGIYESTAKEQAGFWLSADVDIEQPALAVQSAESLRSRRAAFFLDYCLIPDG